MKGQRTILRTSYFGTGHCNVMQCDACQGSSIPLEITCFCLPVKQCCVCGFRCLLMNEWMWQTSTFTGTKCHWNSHNFTVPSEVWFGIQVEVLAQSYRGSCYPAANGWRRGHLRWGSWRQPQPKASAQPQHGNLISHFTDSLGLCISLLGNDKSAFPV